MRFFLLLGIAAPVIRHVMIYGLGWMTPNYSATRDFISELSALGAPYFWPMSVAGVGLIGLMMIPASYALYRNFAPLPGGRVAAWLLGISGVAFICIALFPCDPGCEATELNSRMIAHLVAGATATGAEVSSAFVFGLAGVMHRRYNAITVSALVLGIIGLIAYFLLFTGITDAPAGLVQRVVQGSGDLWLLIACVTCLRLLPSGEPVTTDTF